jgi:proteasome lid subunit RPN8/RPN11
MTVEVYRSELNKFILRGARLYPLEHIEAMFGSYRSGHAVVSLFYPMDYAGSTRTSCLFDEEDEPEEIDLLNQIAREHGLRFLGTVHTHPGMNTCSHPSETDVDTFIEWGEIVSGTVNIFRWKGEGHAMFHVSSPWEPVKLSFL